ncbi:MAG: extracellular solute-binding protein [Lachnospiraceae bacterium]|nr:extracellular solute-binding protein [Lachnospiraceae bacterium]
MKKFAVIFFTIVMLAGLSACGNEETEVLQTENADVEQEKITLDWYVNYSWFATPWGENLVSKAITEETGVNVHFVTPIGNETEKLNALIASDTLPDMITLGYWEPQVDEMIDKDMVFALNELADTYAPQFWEVTDETAVNWYTREDGNIYAYPNSSISPKDLEENASIGSNQTFLVRKDIYTAIGSPDMTTPEGFMEAVKKAAEMFPEAEGKPLVPIGAHCFDNEGNVSFDKFLMNFLAVPWEKDGKLYDRYTDAEYVKWLKMFRQLGEEGYLATDIFVDTRTQMEEKLAEGRYFCMLYQYTDMLSQQKVLYENDPDKVYIAVEGPRNANGDAPTLSCTSVSGWTVTLISKNCKDPKRAIEFMSYLMGEEGQKTIFLGVEGETYDVVDKKAIVKSEVKELLDTDRIAYDTLYGADNAYWMLQDLVMQQKWQQTSSPAEEQLKEWSRKYVVYNGQYETVFPAGSESAIAQDKITTLWSETLPQLLLAPTEEEFDTIFAAFIAERDALGYAKVMEDGTEYMIEAKKKLGLME